MIVEKNDHADTWIVRDQGRGFEIVQAVAEAAYRDYLKRCSETEGRAKFIAADAPHPPRHLPDMRTFLEMLATEKWDREGIRPS